MDADDIDTGEPGFFETGSDEKGFDMDRVTRWVRGFAVALALAAPGAGAQDGRGDVVYVPTPQIVVDEMLQMAKVGPKDYVIDLGSGDGRIVVTAAKQFGARGFGVDLDTHLNKLANERASKEGVADRARFIEQNLFETDLGSATVITSYLLPEMNLKLRPKLLSLKPGTRVVAHDYAMGDWDPDDERILIVPEKTVGDPGKSYVYLWVVPARVAGRWESQLPVGGRTVAYQFAFEQRYQVVQGSVRIDQREFRLPQIRLNGEEMNFPLNATIGGSLVSHRFRGWVKDDVIEGTVTIGEGAGQRVTPWRAKLTARGEARMSAVAPALAGAFR
ncbi:MAG: methyltransferase domain-containing protein [Betaproteobacteria bacterium]|nr:methyltransferase domain-containing protein [Betaproteobacteria bacterium]